MKRILLLAALIASPTPSMAQDKPIPSLFGITIMQPISVPECAFDPKAVEKYRKAVAKFPTLGLHFPYDINRSAPCYKRRDQFAGMTEGPANESLTIHFPMSAPPEGAKWDSVYATIIDGKVQGIGFMTYGLSSQSLVMDQLRGKFGEPTTNKVVAKQNGYGAKFDSIEAAWSLTGGTMLFFESTGMRTDYGIVSLRTPTAQQQYLDSMKKLTGGTAM